MNIQFCSSLVTKISCHSLAVSRYTNGSKDYKLPHFLQVRFLPPLARFINLDAYWWIVDRFYEMGIGCVAISSRNSRLLLITSKSLSGQVGKIEMLAASHGLGSTYSYVAKALEEGRGTRSALQNGSSIIGQLMNPKRSCKFIVLITLSEKFAMTAMVNKTWS